jgi:SAM-dependent methyltransferase
MKENFESVTELSGAPITEEQLVRLVNRYVWASTYCAGRDVVEAACGCGPGLGLLVQASRSLVAGDYFGPILERAKSHYGDRIVLLQFDAQKLPCADNSKDVIILFEAIYYLAAPESFVDECRRVLRPGGKVLVATANKDLWDFLASQFSHRYFGACDLEDLFETRGFAAQIFGYQRADRVPLRQRILRPIKKLAVATGLIPKTMAGKRWVKRIVFGRELAMPAEINASMAVYEPPEPLPAKMPDKIHKIIYAVATLQS